MVSEQLHVSVDAGAPPEEMAAIRQIFDARGIEAEVQDNYVRLSAGDLPWAVDVVCALKWLALAFSTGFVGAAGADAWKEYRAGGWRGLAQFIKEITSVRDGDGTITIRDPEGPDIHLDAGIPDEALAALADLDWQQMSDGMLGWNDERGEWWFLQARRAPRGTPAPRREDS